MSHETKSAKESRLWLAVFFTILQASVPNAANADIIQGEITSLDRKANVLTVLGINPETGRAQEVKVSVPRDRNVELAGVRSLKDLKRGDKVWIDVSGDDASGVLEMEADAISVARASESA